jgi:putative ABC transport system substrate-binding protein
MSEMLKEAADAAGTLGLQLQLVEVHGPDEFDRAFAIIAGARAEALFQFPSAMLFSQARRIVDLAAMHRLPAMYNAREFVCAAAGVEARHVGGMGRVSHFAHN